MAPLIRQTGEALGLSVASESALAAGLVMGMMIIPFISSLSDDVINAVPQSLRCAWPEMRGGQPRRARPRAPHPTSPRLHPVLEAEQ